MIVDSAVHALADRARETFGLPHGMYWTLARGVVDHGFWCDFWLGRTPHPGQLVWGSHHAKRAFKVTGRRYGKSEGEGMRRHRRMFYRPRTMHLNAAITQDQATIVLDKMDGMAAGSRIEPFYVHLPAKNGFPRRGMVNKAEVWFRSTQNDARYLRGWSFHEANLDEAAHAKHRVWTEVLTQCVMDYDGLLSGTTTPLGKNWLFYEAGRARAIMRAQLARGVPVRRLEAFFRHGPSYENPHLPRSVWRWMRSLPKRSRDQEIEGLFIDLENALFTDDDVTAFTNPDLNPGGDDCVKEPSADHSYLLAWDLARKRHGSTLLLGRIDCRPWQIIRAISLRGLGWRKQKATVEEVARHWRAQVYYDAQGVGDGVGAFLDVPATQVLTPGTRALEEHLSNLQRAGCSEPPMFETLYHEELDYDCRHFTWDAEEEEDDNGEIHHWDWLKCLAYFVHGAMIANPGVMPAVSGNTRVMSRTTEPGSRTSRTRIPGY